MKWGKQYAEKPAPEPKKTENRREEKPEPKKPENRREEKPEPEPMKWGKQYAEKPAPENNKRAEQPGTSAFYKGLDIRLVTNISTDIVHVTIDGQKTCCGVKFRSLPQFRLGRTLCERREITCVCCYTPMMQEIMKNEIKERKRSKKFFK